MYSSHNINPKKIIRVDTQKIMGGLKLVDFCLHQKLHKK